MMMDFEVLVVCTIIGSEYVMLLLLIIMIAWHQSIWDVVLGEMKWREYSGYDDGTW